MTNSSPTPEAKPPSPFANLSNTELAVIRTDLAQERTDMAQERTTLAGDRCDLASTRTDLARERTRMASERTIMAWIRTSLSLITFGFGIDRFFAYLDKTQTNTDFDILSQERLLGLGFITLGVFALVAAIVTHWQTLKNIERQNYTFTPRWSLGMTVAIVLVAIGLATYIPLIATDVNLQDIITLDSPIIRNLTSLTIFAVMFAMGLTFSLRELLAVWQRPKAILTALFAAAVLVPAIAIALLWFVQLPSSVVIGLILLVAAPGAPLLTKRVQIAGGSFDYGASLQVTLSLVAVLVTPTILGISGFLFPVATEPIGTLQVAMQIAVVQFLPLSLGLGLKQIAAEVVDEIGDFLRIVANVLTAILAILLLALSLDLIPSLGIAAIGVISAIVLGALSIGHLLGGETPADRTAVANASLARNVTLALFIAITNQQTEAIPTILAYLILATIVALPYSVWMRRQITITTPDESTAINTSG